jgi:hypothetical protein
VDASQKFFATILAQRQIVLDAAYLAHPERFVNHPPKSNQLPRAYSKEFYDQKCDVVYQHFYEAYMGQGQSVYAVN